MLVPFEYYGISDGTDLTRVRWTRAGYDTGALAEVYTGNDARVDLVLAQLRRRVVDPRRVRAIAFCVSVEHAEFMARALSERGIPAAAVHSGTAAADRQSAPRRLREREVNVLLARRCPSPTKSSSAQPLRRSLVPCPRASVAAMSTKFEQLCAAYQASRDGFAEYRIECTSFLLRVGHQLETAWGVPSLRLALPTGGDPAKTPAAKDPKAPAKPTADPTEAAFDPATGVFRLDASFDVQAGSDDSKTKSTRTVTVPLAVRKEGNGFVLSIDEGTPKNVGGGSEAEVAPLLDDAFGRVMARFEPDPRQVRDTMR